MNGRFFCGIDTSNYTTSAAAVTPQGEIAANLKAPLPVGEGARGLRQSDALFAHIKNLPGLTDRLGEVIEGSPAAIGVSVTPRSCEGSYMPCFLAGKAAAHSFAAAAGIPCYEFSHQQGHVAAAYITSGAMASIGRKTFLAFHVSGGTTELLLVDPVPGAPVIELLGGTADLNAGQAVDRAGVAMGMSFPCGPEMDRAASGYLKDGGSMPSAPRISVKGLECNLSGLENKVSGLIEKGSSHGEISLFVFDFIGRTLERLALNAREKYGPLPVVWAGGVMSNSIIKKRLSALPDVYFAEPCYSADNAAGIALLCRERYMLEHGND